MLLRSRRSERYPHPIWIGIAYCKKACASSVPHLPLVPAYGQLFHFHHPVMGLFHQQGDVGLDAVLCSLIELAQASRHRLWIALVTLLR